jgi:Polysaccharide lyase
MCGKIKYLMVNSMNKIVLSTFVVLLVFMWGCSENPLSPNGSTKEISVAQEQSGSYTQDGMVLTSVTPSITFENASIVPGSNNTGYLIDGGVQYATVTKGTVGVNYLDQLITSAEKYKGNYSIQFQMPRTTVLGSITNDKVQNRIISGSQTGALHLGDTRYFGFAVKLDTSMEQPLSPCQLFQIWQGGPMGPPLSLDVTSGGSGNTIKFRVWIRNNETQANPSAGIQIYLGSIQKGVWNKFVIMVTMRTTADENDGQIKLWLNGNKVLNWNGRAGYYNGIIYGGVGYTPNANFDVFFGPYRDCQQAIVNMYFDQVKHATSYADAIP